MRDRDVKQGETVFREGEESDFVAYLLAGRLEVVRAVEGREVVIGVGGAGEYVGEMGVLESRPRLATVRSLTAARLQIFDASEFLEKVSSDPRVALGGLQRLSERLRHANERRARARSGPGARSPTASSAAIPTPPACRSCARPAARPACRSSSSRAIAPRERWASSARGSRPSSR